MVNYENLSGCDIRRFQRDFKTETAEKDLIITYLGYSKTWSREGFQATFESGDDTHYIIRETEEELLELLELIDGETLDTDYFNELLSEGYYLNSSCSGDMHIQTIGGFYINF